MDSKLPLRVDWDRWQQAQRWEAEFWKSQNPSRRMNAAVRFKTFLKGLLGKETHNLGDDWNQWWAQKFHNYNALPREMGKAVELGCGPYTNMRLILENRRISEVWCSDPLVSEYLKFDGRWLAEAAKKGRIQIDNHPIEACPFDSDSFDLVVLINVLDHVRDGMACMDQAIRITRPGGFLIVGQDLSNLEDSRLHADDIGHPIRIDHEALNRVLMPRFNAVQHEILARELGRNPDAHYGTYLFLGRKRSSS